MSNNTIDYTLKLRPERASDKKQRRVYSSPVFREKVDSKDIASELVSSTTLTETDIIAVLTGLSERLASHLRSGELVTLEGIGSFGVRLKSEQGTDRKGRLTTKDTRVSGILFRPSEEFLTKVRDVHFRLTAGPRIKMPDDEEILQKLNEHFATKDFITCPVLADKLGVSKRRSHQIAARLVEQGILSRRGRGSTTHYVLGEKGSSAHTH